VFVRLYREGLIYRAQRMVNWSPAIRTVLSDLEVEEREVKGHLWYIAYPVVGSDERLVVATTRPETMLGDTAVAVHPEDPRYRHLIGRRCQLPLTDREIPIIGDAIAVDPRFGTGAVKITPGHDFADFETGQRHGLPVITILTEDARLNDKVPPKYQGMDRYEARDAVVEDLRAAGLLVKVEDYTHVVGHCQRSGVVVEPTVSLQWFVRMKPLAEPAIEAVRDGRTVFIPKSWEKTYFNWMENIRDWCISRQLWWGHQVPVWYCTTNGCEGLYVDVDPPPKGHACPRCGGTSWRQDDDVLDTWFSSALWPFSTLGWPEQTKALRTFYPTSVMETGFDIIFFWVARMMMMGLHFMGDVPFRTVFLHAMVRDERGQKMSKTRGNVIDPLELVNQYGADALRFALITMAAQGRDVKLSVERVKGYREFVNKLWNATRFALMHLEGGPMSLDRDLSPADQWILTRLGQTLKSVHQAIMEYRFNEAALELYQFTWHRFCDWYLELAKGALSAGGERARATQGVICFVLDRVLRALHPFMPFVTEELWQRIRPMLNGAKESIVVAQFPTGEDCPIFSEEAKAMEVVLEVIGGVRALRSQLRIPPAEVLDVVLRPHSKEAMERLVRHADDVARLARVNLCAVDQAASRPVGSAVAVGQDADAYVVVGVERLEAEVARLRKEREKMARDLDQVQKKLANENFLAKAREEVVEAEREKAEAMGAALARIADSLATLEA